jgi:hypothetical protein
MFKLVYLQDAFLVFRSRQTTVEHISRIKLLHKFLFEFIFMIKNKKGMCAWDQKTDMMLAGLQLVARVGYASLHRG